MTKALVLAVLIAVSPCAIADDPQRVRALARAQEMLWDSQGELQELQTQVLADPTNETLQRRLRAKQAEVRRDRYRVEMETRRFR